MTNINCDAKCIYQKGGKCYFNKVNASVLTPDSNCAYFTSKNKDNK